MWIKYYLKSEKEKELILSFLKIYGIELWQAETLQEKMIGVAYRTYAKPKYLKDKAFLFQKGSTIDCYEENESIIVKNTKDFISSVVHQHFFLDKD